MFVISFKSDFKTRIHRYAVSYKKLLVPYSMVSAGMLSLVSVPMESSVQWVSAGDPN